MALTLPPQRLASLMMPTVCLGLTIYSAVRRDGKRMNQHGQRAMSFWREERPVAYSQLPDPEAFFTEMGEEIAGMIADLTPKLAGPDLPDETYMQKVGRLTNARVRATEIAMQDCGAMGTPELTRQEWEDTTQENESSLQDWAMETSIGLENETVDDTAFAETAERYLLDESYLRALVAAIPAPIAWMDRPENRAEWERSVERRWQRDQRAALNSDL